MKLKSLLFLAASAVCFQANAQSWVSDTVVMGPGYANDIFYNLDNGNKKAQPANDWDLAFQMYSFAEPSFSATVRANNTRKKVAVFSMNKEANTANFAAFGASDTVGKTTPVMQLVNVDTSWGAGGFTRNRGTDQFDYGWGDYDFNTHHVVGDSLYLVKVNTTAYKVWIQRYVSLTDTLGYMFRVATLDNSVDNSVYIKKKPNYTNRLFAYYDIAANNVVDREPGRNEWDILFTQYARVNASGEPIFGQNPASPQAYTGVLSNLYVEVAKVKTANADSAKLAQAGTFSAMTDAIGDDWKKLNFQTFTYDMDTVTYFVKSENSQKFYQLRFTFFEGTTTGVVAFDRRMIEPTAVQDVTNNINTYALVPNPANNDANFVMEAKEVASNVVMVVTDVTGRVMQRSTVNLNKGMNAFSINTSNFATGTYFVTVSNGKWTVADKLSVQH